MLAKYAHAFFALPPQVFVARLDESAWPQASKAVDTTLSCIKLYDILFVYIVNKFNLLFKQVVSLFIAALTSF